jgi:hypothetical protein
MDQTELALAVGGGAVLMGTIGILIELAWRLFMIGRQHKNCLAQKAKLQTRSVELHRKTGELQDRKKEYDRALRAKRKQADDYRRDIKEAEQKPGELLYVTYDRPAQFGERLFAVKVRLTPETGQMVDMLRWREDRLALVWAGSPDAATEVAKAFYAGQGYPMVSQGIEFGLEQLARHWGA